MRSFCFSEAPSPRQKTEYRWFTATAFSLLGLLAAVETVGAAGTPAESAYRYEITINHFSDTVLFLGYPYGDKKYIQDTASNRSGHTFVFEGAEALSGGLYFIYSPNNVYFDLIVSEPSFSLQTDTLDLIGNLKVNGSPENELFFRFQHFMRDRQKTARQLSEQLKTLEGKPEAETLRRQLGEIDLEVKRYREELISSHPDLFAAKFIRSTMDVEVPEPPAGADQNFRYHYYKAHYFEHFDFSDERILRTPNFHERLMGYLDRLTVKHPDSIVHSAHAVIDKARANKEVFRYCLVTITNQYETSNIMGMDAVFVDLAESYYLKGDAWWADSSLVTKIEKRVQELKPNLIGKNAPSLQLLDTLMRPFSLQGLKSDFTVLYFYDPDCGHCKKKTPELLSLYEKKLKSLGVEVIYVCTDTDVDKWKKYVRDNKINTLNGADPQYRSNFRFEYNINTTPKIYIVDGKKAIIAKNLDVDQIEEFINHQISLRKQQPSG
jgi:peroxiredoxin